MVGGLYMDMPLVVIALAICSPQKEWLREQLCSLNCQEYTNLQLLVWNDGEAEDDCREVFRECISNFPYRMIQGTKHIGSTKAFEELTAQAEGDYIAYCDQDDIWETYKIRRLVQESLSRNADLVCSDASVIDACGNTIADSIGEIRPRQRLYAGENISAYLLTRNFVMGCTILVKREMAQKALPFPEHGLHDWWLALHASVFGRVVVLREPLIKYRIHGANQTGMLKDIDSLQAYYEKKILGFASKMEEVQWRFKDTPFSLKILPYIAWGKARERYYKHSGIGSFMNLLCYIHIDYQVTCFELCAKLLPAATVPCILRIIKGRK